MKHKVEFIRQKEYDKNCKTCNGNGILFEGTVLGVEIKEPEHCDTCKGTGIILGTNYIMVTNGMAFDVDGFK